MTSFSNILVQGGLIHRAAERYGDEQAVRARQKLRDEDEQAEVELRGRSRPMREELLRGQFEDATEAREQKHAYRGAAAEAARQGIGVAGEPGNATFASRDAVRREAERRGDFDTSEKMLKALKSLEAEGFKALTIGALSGKSPQELEAIFNSTGTGRVQPGTLKVDDMGNISAISAQDGKSYSFNALKYAELAGLVKPKKAMVLNPGDELYQDGRRVAGNTAGLEAKQGFEMKKLDREYALKQGLEEFKQKNSPSAATAMARNIEFLVNAKIAKDPADAFEKLRRSMERSEEDATLDLTKALLGRVDYIGKGGTERAQTDARAIVRSIRGAKGEGPSSAFKSEADVKAAFKAGRINRARAIKELEAFGFAPE